MISIFIPTYNGEQLLPRTLDSILAQTYTDWELVAVDDSSTDGSYALLQEYASRETRIRLFQKPNEGDVPHAWRYAIPRLQGDFVLYMSQDDLLAPTTLQQLVDRQRETDADAVLPHEIHYLEGLPLEQMHHLHGVAGDTSPILTGQEAFRLMIDYSISGRALWRKSIIEQCGICTETFNADELAQRQWVLACKRVAFSDALFYYCRGNQASITQRFHPRIYGDTLTNARLYTLAAHTFPHEKDYLHQLANRNFYHLYLRLLHYQHHRQTYSPTQRRTISHQLRTAYQLLHHHTAYQQTKYRLAAKGWPLMWTTAQCHHLRLKSKGLPVSPDIDCYSQYTPQ